jgi:hypothetical protein
MKSQQFGAGAIREPRAAGWFRFFGIAQLGIAALRTHRLTTGPLLT